MLDGMQPTESAVLVPFPGLEPLVTGAVVERLVTALAGVAASRTIRPTAVRTTTWSRT